MDVNVDVHKMYADLPRQIDTLMFSYKGGKQELRNILQFMHFIICRYVITRRELGVLDYVVDEMEQRLVANTSDKDDSGLVRDYVKDIRYTPFYYQIWSDTEPVELPALEDVQGKSINDLSRILNTDPGKLKNAISYVKPARILKLEGESIRFSQNAYSEFREWINRYNRLFVEAGNLSQLILDRGYGYNVDQKRSPGKVLLDIYESSQGAYNTIIERRLTKLKNMPSEMNELLALIWMVRTKVQ